MDEPMQGVVFILEDIKLNQEVAESLQKTDKDSTKDAVDYGPFGGQVLGTIRNLCKRSFLNSEPRVVEAMYNCSMQASHETYGDVYKVIHQVRGRVINEEIQDGTNYFLMDALIPLVEGFVFTDQIRKKSAGIAYPQLVFHGFEVNVANDPFFLPKTIEDIEDLGSGEGMEDNIAKKLIEKVRKQKGLSVSKALVIHANKQRNITKSK